jgi:death-on-curing protein
MTTDEPLFLTRAQINRLHDLSLAKFGGSTGIRDDGMIESALGSAQNAFFLGKGDLFDIAAAYAFHIAESQAFIDGNKRTGMGAALLFLDVNGVQTTASNDMLYDAMIAIANKGLNKAGFAAILRERALKKD